MDSTPRVIDFSIARGISETKPSTMLSEQTSTWLRSRPIRMDHFRLVRRAMSGRSV